MATGMAKVAAGLQRALGIPRKAPILGQMGASGTAHWGGWIVSLEHHADLKGTRRYKTYGDMLVNTSMVAAGVRHFLNLVSNAAWKVEPAEDGGSRADMVADAVRAALFHDMRTPWHRSVRRMSMFRHYGFSLQEWVAGRSRDGHITFLDLMARPQSTIERWDFDEHGSVVGAVQKDPNTQRELYLPRTKLAYALDDALNDSPEGLGALRAAANIARKLQRFEQLEGYGFETDLRGVPVGRAPIAALQQAQKDGVITPLDYARALEPMKNFIVSHIKGPSTGMLLDSAPYRTLDDSSTPSAQAMWGLDLLKASSTSQPDVARAIDRLNWELARVIGMESMLVGSDGKGSYALSKDKTSSLLLTIDGTLSEVNTVVNRDLVDRLMELNGWDLSLRPNVTVENVHMRDVEKAVIALRDMASAGAVLAPDDPAINEVRDLLGFSHADLEGNAAAAAEDAALARGKGRVTREVEPE